MTVQADSLPDDPSTLKAIANCGADAERAASPVIKELQRHRLGRRAETLPEDQMLLGLEDVEQVAASSEAKIEAVTAERANRSATRRTNRGSLPAHLPRIEMVVDIQEAN